jgi:hypothetical protein
MIRTGPRETPGSHLVDTLYVPSPLSITAPAAVPRPPETGCRGKKLRSCARPADSQRAAKTSQRLRKLGKRVSAIPFAYLGCRTARVRSRSVQDLSPSDSDLSQLAWRWGSRSGFREGDSRRSGRRPDRAKPQVTKVIGVFDPYRFTRVGGGSEPNNRPNGDPVSYDLQPRLASHLP